MAVANLTCPRPTTAAPGLSASVRSTAVTVTTCCVSPLLGVLPELDFLAMRMAGGAWYRDICLRCMEGANGSTAKR